MIVSAERSTPHPVVLTTLHKVSGTVPSRWVTSPASCAYERSATRRHTVELDCNALFAHLVGYDDTACPHILQKHDDSGVRRLGNIHVP
jgi:hypothetical protein